MDEEKVSVQPDENDDRQAIGGFLKAVALGIGICEVITVLVFLIIGKFSLSIVFGALYGGAVMTFNYFLMAKGVARAAKETDPEVAKKRIQASYSQRLIMLVVLFGVGFFLYAQFGFIHWIPLALSIIYPRIAIGVWQQRYRKMAKDEPLTAGNPDAYADIDEKEEEADF